MIDEVPPRPEGNLYVGVSSALAFSIDSRLYMVNLCVLDDHNLQCMIVMDDGEI